MFHPVYKCDDYDFNDGVLVAQIETLTEWAVVETLTGMYDVMICPNMFTDKDGNKPNIAIFK